MVTAVKENPLQELLEHGPVTLQSPLTREEFAALAARFPDLQMEREANGKTNIMSPVKKGSGKRETTLLGYLWMWFTQHGKGEVYNSSTGIELPNGAIKSPDCAWVSDKRLALLPKDSDEDFLKAVPDFVAEIKSQSDRITALKKKMVNSWMSHGVRLAWLIDPYSEKAWIYRENEKDPELVEGFKGKSLSGEDVMPGFELPMDKLRVKKG